MNLIYGNTYWNNVNKNYKSYPKLTKDEVCDVVIVGAGLAGCLTAYYLALYNVNTILIEKDIIGAGTTSSSDGMLQPELNRTLLELSRLIPKGSAERAYKLSVKASDEFENTLFHLSKVCDFSRKDTIYSNPLVDLKKEYELRRKLDFEVNYINLPDSIEKFTINEEDAIVIKNTATIDPLKYSHTLVKAFEALGGRIYEHTPLTSYDYSENKMKAATDDFNIVCKKIVFSTGLSTLKLLKKPVFSLKNTFGIVTNPVNGVKDCIDKYSMVMKDNQNLLHMRTTSDNRVMVLQYCTDERKETEIEAVMKDKTQYLLRKVQSMYTDYNMLSIDYQWSSTYIESKDDLPYIGTHSKYPNCYFNLPAGTNSNTYSIIGAQLIKDLILYGSNCDKNLFSFER
jgi:glycine/D-amino acid oxidase-like deaminating enzyme